MSKVVNFLSPRKISWGGIFGVLTVSGTQELCVTAVSRVFVNFFCLKVPKIFEERTFFVFDYMPVLGIEYTCMLQINMPGKTIQEKIRKFVVILKTFLILIKKVERTYESQNFLSSNTE